MFLLQTSFTQSLMNSTFTRVFLTFGLVQGHQQAPYPPGSKGEMWSAENFPLVGTGMVCIQLYQLLTYWNTSVSLGKQFLTKPAYPVPIKCYPDSLLTLTPLPGPLESSCNPVKTWHRYRDPGPPVQLFGWDYWSVTMRYWQLNIVTVTLAIQINTPAQTADGGHITKYLLPIWEEIQNKNAE